MRPLKSKISLVLTNLFILLSHCRGIISKALFCRYVVATAWERFAIGPVSSTALVNETRSSGRESFLRFKHADLWFGSAPGTHELSPYIEIFITREYDDDYLTLGQEDTIIDIGANVGLFTIRYGKRFPGMRIFSFEPHPVVYQRLLKNLEVNDIANAVAVNAAITSSPGRASLFVGRATVAGSLIAPARRLLPAFYVRAITLDAFCQAHSVASIGLLKIDVEGAEVAVLDSAQEVLKITKCIMVECHSLTLENSVRTILAEHGFVGLVKRDWAHGARVLHFTRAGKHGPDATPANA